MHIQVLNQKISFFFSLVIIIIIYYNIYDYFFYCSHYGNAEERTEDLIYSLDNSISLETGKHLFHFVRFYSERLCSHSNQDNKIQKSLILLFYYYYDNKPKSE